MTQRVDLATVMDRLAIDELITGYAVAVDDADWAAYRALFTAGGRADYRSSGGIEGGAGDVADWLAQVLALFPVRQHYIVNRRVHIQDLGGYPGDRAEVRADYLNPMRTEAGDELVGGGRYEFALVRVADGWRLTSVVVQEKWRRVTGALAGGAQPG
ncbi:nuclear transport factor 2 family protein [Streptomyces sp. NPDC001941]|uniref:nuclear transport factor 2 family protein n=1 Tax=Streptomyces sp. NPDC001941 TaxID=3154659 RepID=UPI00331A270B